MAEEGEVSEDCHWPNHVHNWTAARRFDATTSQVEEATFDNGGVEKASYQPLVDYLTNVVQLTAQQVANNSSLPNALLFDVFVYSLRSKALRLNGDEPRSKFHLKGRTEGCCCSHSW